MDKFVVFNAWVTAVFFIVPINLTFADEPRTVLSVIVNVAVLCPAVFPEILTRSPCEPVPPPAVSMDRV